MTTRARADGTFLIGFEDVLPNVTVPCLFHVSENDEHRWVRKIASRVPNAMFVSFPDLDHCEATYQSDLVPPYVTKSLEEADEC